MKTRRSHNSNQLWLPLRMQHLVQCSHAGSGGKPNRMTGLTWDGAKNRWNIRFTVDVGSKKVGKRVQVRLKTPDVETAIVYRDGMIAMLRQLGLTVRPRAIERDQIYDIPRLLPAPDQQFLAPAEGASPVVPAEPSPLTYGELRGRE